VFLIRTFPGWTRDRKRSTFAVEFPTDTADAVDGDGSSVEIRRICLYPLGISIVQQIAFLLIDMDKSNIHPELHQWVDEQSRNQAALWIYLFIGFPILIIIDWWKSVLNFETRIFSYIGLPVLFFAIGYGFHLLDKRRFCWLSWLLYNVRPVTANIRLRLDGNDENLRYEATIEPLIYAVSVLPSQKIMVGIPAWDSAWMVGKMVTAKCYVHPESQKCEIIRTEKGLLIRL
jgi:hypothetical protein